MRLAVFALVLFCAAVSASAQEMRVDGSSKETYERSIRAMADGLSEQDKEAFGRGLFSLIITGYPPAAGAEGLGMIHFVKPAVEAAHITLDGVSRAEILAKGREILAKDATKAQKAAVKTAAKTVANDNILECLRQRVLISNAKIDLDYGRTKFSSRTDRKIFWDVTNNLPWAIAGIRVEYAAMSEGRSVPWKKDSFALGISGGIESGETRTLSIFVSITSDAPDELIATMTVLDVADPLKRLLIKDVGVGGWAKEKSPLACE